jgi:hypothetical protein
VTWKTIRRETGLIEHICEHGCGHPNAGSVQYMEYHQSGALEEYYRQVGKWRDDNPSVSPELCPVEIEVPNTPYTKSTWWIHGCDGCCATVSFPGTAAGAIKHSIQRYIDERPDLLDDLKRHHFLLWWGIMAALNEARGLREEH